MVGYGNSQVAGGLFSKLLEVIDINQLKEIFEITASPYWDDHFVFGSLKKGMSKKTGAQAADILLINAVIPILFVYGKIRGLEEYSDRALSFLEQIKAEENSIIEEWSVAGIEAESALCSQALIQLRDNYCRKRRCLDCRVGFRLISSGARLKEYNELLLEP
jgi:hypothetical protein